MNELGFYGILSAAWGLNAGMLRILAIWSGPLALLYAVAAYTSGGAIGGWTTGTLVACSIAVPLLLFLASRVCQGVSDWCQSVAEAVRG